MLRAQTYADAGRRCRPRFPSDPPNPPGALPRPPASAHSTHRPVAPVPPEQASTVGAAHIDPTRRSEAAKGPQSAGPKDEVLGLVAGVPAGDEVYRRRDSKSGRSGPVRLAQAGWTVSQERAGLVLCAPGVPGGALCAETRFVRFMHVAS